MASDSASFGLTDGTKAGKCCGTRLRTTSDTHASAGKSSLATFIVLMAPDARRSSRRLMSIVAADRIPESTCSGSSSGFSIVLDGPHSAQQSNSSSSSRQA
eukprot:352598-Chlamydomonas_euryale.AAC.24